MAKKVVKKDSPEVDHLKEVHAKRIVSILSLSAVFGMGLWMILDPDGGKHSTVEKSTVYLIKEMWSFETGVIFITIAIFFIALTIRKMRMLSGKVWIKEDSGYFLFNKKERISGLSSLSDGNDLVVFNTINDEVYRFKNYYGNAKMNKYFKALIEPKFNCQDAFWRAREDGYNLYYKGKDLDNITSSRDANDLIITSEKLNKKFKLENYYNRKDNTIRMAEEV